MKFTRHVTIFRSHLDVAPFAGVFFLLVMFMMLASLVYTPGARLELQLPKADGLAGTDRPSVSVAIDADGRLYYQNQWIEESDLRSRLQSVAQNSAEPLTLVVHADKNVTYDKFLRLALLGREAGISEALLATLPRVSGVPAGRSSP